MNCTRELLFFRAATASWAAAFWPQGEASTSVALAVTVNDYSPGSLGAEHWPPRHGAPPTSDAARFQDWYFEIPFITRVYVTTSFVTTAACALELVSPFSLYFNARLIIYKYQARRMARARPPPARCSATLGSVLAVVFWLLCSGWFELSDFLSRCGDSSPTSSSSARLASTSSSTCSSWCATAGCSRKAPSEDGAHPLTPPPPTAPP